MKKVLLAVLMVALCAGLFAQEYRATIVGVVTDPSGASIPNASVKAVNTATNNTTETKTTSDGLYALPFLEPGVYRLEVAAPGFQSLRRDAGTGPVGQRLNGTPISNEGSTWEFAPSVDAIQEFSAMTTVYDAQYGHEAGGVVNTVIRGGNNNWHGDVYDYFRNAVLDANNFGNNYAGAAKG